MKVKKPIFIPGLGERPSNYRALSRYFEIVDIDWNVGRMKIGKADILVGFSMGAVMACEYAIKKRVKLLILCSITPGIETLKEVMADKVIFLVGEREKWVLREVKRVQKTLKAPSAVVVVRGAGHKINNTYQKNLLKFIR